MSTLAGERVRAPRGSVSRPARRETPDLWWGGQRSGNGPGRVLLVSSNGGHLAQLLALRPWWAERDRTWVSFRKLDAVSKLAGESVYWAHHPTTRSARNLVLNFALAGRVLAAVRPDVIVSTGAGVALPFFVLGRLLGIATVYIEVYDRIESRTLSGRLCRPFATRFLVQWAEQERLYPGAQLVGPLL